jgi:hypothetical protein
MVVNVGYVRYISTDSPHTYLMSTSEMRDAKAEGSHGSFTIKLDFGRQYHFAAVDEKGKEVSAGPILSEIKYSMGSEGLEGQAGERRWVMKNLVRFLGLCLLAALFCVNAAWAADAAKRRVAIFDFDFGAVHRWWTGD